MAKKQASNLKEERNELLNKRFRLTMDFTMTVCEITHETLRDRFRASTEFSPHTLECAKRDNQLLLSLFKKKKILKKVILSLLVDEARALMDEEQDNVFGMEELEDILKPIYTRMDREDVEYLQSFLEQNCFIDGIDLFWRSFDIKCAKADIEEVQVFMEGEVKKKTELSRLITL
jgi:hypothetical protein